MYPRNEESYSATVNTWREYGNKKKKNKKARVGCIPLVFPRLFRNTKMETTARRDKPNTTGSPQQDRQRSYPIRLDVGFSRQSAPHALDDT